MRESDQTVVAGLTYQRWGTLLFGGCYSLIMGFLALPELRQFFAHSSLKLVQGEPLKQAFTYHFSSQIPVYADGHKVEANQIVIDAGGLALSKDRATAALGPGDLGYGLVLDAAGEPSFGRLVVVGVHQEHGEIRGKTPLPFDRLPIGARVRVLPNHVCMTAAAYDRCLVTDGDEVSETWGRVNGW